MWGELPYRFNGLMPIDHPTHTLSHRRQSALCVLVSVLGEFYVLHYLFRSMRFSVTLLAYDMQVCWDTTLLLRYKMK